MNVLIAFWDWVCANTPAALGRPGRLARPAPLRVVENWREWLADPSSIRFHSRIATLHGNPAAQEFELKNFFAGLIEKRVREDEARLVIFQLVAMPSAPLRDWLVPEELNVCQLGGVRAVTVVRVNGVASTGVSILAAVPVVSIAGNGAVRLLNVDPVGDEARRTSDDARRSVFFLLSESRLLMSFCLLWCPRHWLLRWGLRVAWSVPCVLASALLFLPPSFLPHHWVPFIVRVLVVVSLPLTAFTVGRSVILFRKNHQNANRLRSLFANHAFALIVTNVKRGKRLHVEGGSFGLALFLALLRAVLHLENPLPAPVGSLWSRLLVELGTSLDEGKDLIRRGFTGVLLGLSKLGSVEMLPEKGSLASAEGATELVCPAQREVNLVRQQCAGGKPLKVVPCRSIEAAILCLTGLGRWSRLRLAGKAACACAVILLALASGLGQVSWILKRHVFAVDPSGSADFVLLFDNSEERRDLPVPKRRLGSPPLPQSRLKLRAKVDRPNYYLHLQLADEESLSSPLVKFDPDMSYEGTNQAVLAREPPLPTPAGSRVVVGGVRGNATARIEFGESGQQFFDLDSQQFKSNATVRFLSAQEFLWNDLQPVPLADLPLRGVVERVNERAQSLSVLPVESVGGK